MTKYKLNQVSIRLVKERSLLSEEPFGSPWSAVKVMNELLKDYDREVLAVVNLQNDMKPINMNIVSIGTLTASIAHPREILKSVVLSNSAATILIHNHPSGKLTPSREDINLTGRMKEILDLLDIQLLDHIILGQGDRYYSFKEHAQMPITEALHQYAEDQIDLKERNRQNAPER